LQPQDTFLSPLLKHNIMIVDDVFDNAVENKSPVNHMSLGEAIACEPPNFVMGYYNCQGTGVLESVETYDDDSIAERTETRDPPPPIQEESEDDDSEDDDSDDDDSDIEDSDIEEVGDSVPTKGLLAKARCGTSSFVVLEARKKQQYDKKQQPIPESPRRNKKKKSSVQIPVYDKSAAKKRVFLTTAEVMAKLGEEVFDETLDDEALAAAAERWRIAKERYIVRAHRSTESEEPESEEPHRERYSVAHDDEPCSNDKEESNDEEDKKQPDAATDTIEIDVATDDVDADIASGDDDASAPEEKFHEEKSPEDPPGTHQVVNSAIENNGPSTVDILVETFNHAKIEPEPSCSHDDQSPIDEEEENDLLLPENDDEAEDEEKCEDDEVVEEEEDPSVPLYLRNLSRSLKQLERQEVSNMSRLSEQRLRLEQRKQHQMEQRQTTK